MANYISDDKIDEVKSRSSIVDVVSQYVVLKKTGRNFTGLCPFHSEKTPSFTVSEEKEIFHCFGCGAGGNVFSFLMKVEGRSFPEVVRELADKEGVELPDYAPYEDHARGVEDDARGRLIGLNERVADIYHKFLMRSKEGEAAREYLKGRGIDGDVARKWRLGYGGKGWSALSDTLEQGEVTETAEKAGLVIAGKKGGYYDRFRERLIFPIFDLRGRTVAFGGRILGRDDGPKYLNSPESLVYTKGEVLYGLNATRSDVRSASEVVLVEGYMDFLALHSAGITNVAATLGTALTPSQALLLKRFCKKVVFLFDSDAAGLKAALRGIEVLQGAGLASSVLVLPEGEDPDSFVRGNGADLLRKKIEDAEPAIEFIVREKLKGKNNLHPRDKAELVKEIVPMLKALEDRLERDITVRRLAELLSIEDTLIYGVISEGSKRGHKAKRRRESLPQYKNRTEAAEETILQLLFEHEGVIEKAVESGVFSLFRDEEMKLIAEKIEEFFGEGKEITPSSLMNSVESEKAEKRISELSMAGGSFLDDSKPEDIFADCEKKIREAVMVEAEVMLSEKMKEAQNREDHEEIKVLLQKKQEMINKKLERGELDG